MARSPLPRPLPLLPYLTMSTLRSLALAAVLAACLPAPAVESLRQDLPAIDSLLHAGVMGRGTVYLRPLGEGRYRLVQLGIQTVSTYAMSVTACAWLDVKSGQREGRTRFVDGVFGEEFARFRDCYVPLTELLPTLDATFRRANGMDAGWRLEVIGYFIVGDAERPWRWAASFERTDGDAPAERRHFVYEATGWQPMEAAPGFYFADYCE